MARVSPLTVLACGFGLLLVAPARGQSLVSTATGSASVFGDHQVLIESIQGRLDGLAGRVEVVEDQVALLRDTALGGDVTETRAVIVHKNELGSAFTLERARYLLDGGVLLDKVDANGNLASIESLVLFDGRIGAGEHLLEVEVVCRGGGFGLFSYVESYRFKLTSRYVLKVREGRMNRLEVVAYRRPDITLEPSKRLTIRYDFEVLEAASRSPTEGL